MRTSWVPLMNVRTKLTVFTRNGPAPTSSGTSSPSTNAVTSTRSLVPLTRALITTSPAGNAEPGAGCKPLMIGERPGDPIGLAAATAPGDGDGGGGSGVGVEVATSPPAIDRVGGGIFSRRIGVLPP